MTTIEKLSFIDEHEDILRDFWAEHCIDTYVLDDDMPDAFDAWISDHDDDYLTAIIQSKL